MSSQSFYLIVFRDCQIVMNPIYLIDLFYCTCQPPVRSIIDIRQNCGPIVPVQHRVLHGIQMVEGDFRVILLDLLLVDAKDKVGGEAQDR